jgi:RNA polymerase sigma-70 factor, ECF subfamily
MGFTDQVRSGQEPPATERDSESAGWIRGLTAVGAERDAAVERLHALLLRVAQRELRRRSGRSGIVGPELDDLAHQASADALMAITRKLEQFRGDSRFTTWAYRFVVLEVSNRLGRHYWRHQSAPMFDEDWDRLPASVGLGPERQAEWNELVAALRRAIDEELTPHQRRLFVALVLNGVPLDALALELDSNRNAIYKALFDARSKLRRALAANGYETL